MGTGLAAELMGAATPGAALVEVRPVLYQEARSGARAASLAAWMAVAEAVDAAKRAAAHVESAVIAAVAHNGRCVSHPDHDSHSGSARCRAGTHCTWAWSGRRHPGGQSIAAGSRGCRRHSLCCRSQDVVAAVTAAAAVVVAAAAAARGSWGRCSIRH